MGFMRNAYIYNNILFKYSANIIAIIDTYSSTAYIYIYIYIYTLLKYIHMHIFFLAVTSAQKRIIIRIAYMLYTHEK